ncbi:class I SAM-dependent methyltransferase [Amycolatopsis sp. NPDC004079]|uniref:class I SAM-dependent methyltransferase n=1 Tax=Amycolatopsis sp. NPDC004079 TaxID=3154549 RepID=UPI0033A791FC
MTPDAQPSRTALLSAAARAAHLLVDDHPAIFTDPLVHRLLGERAEELLSYHQVYGSHPALSGARASVVTRSRYTENRLAEMAVDQYVILGAGLDSFAYREARPDDLRVFEVDKPATQRWKKKLLTEAGITTPETVEFVAIDFEKDPALTSHLVQAGFDPNRPALVSWLGVTMYLTEEAISQTLHAISGLAPGTELIVEHLLPAALRDEAGQAYAELVMAAAAAHGEPWQTFLSAEQMAALLRDHLLEPREHVRQRDIPVEWKRGDALRPTELSILTRARVRESSPATDPAADADSPTNTRRKPPAPQP